MIIEFHKKFFLVIICLILFFFLADLDSAKIKEGENAPNFTLKNLEGKDVSLSEFRGKFVLINFWATWCGPCKIEMSSLESLYQKFKNKNKIRQIMTRRNFLLNWVITNGLYD